MLDEVDDDEVEVEFHELERDELDVHDNDMHDDVDVAGHEVEVDEQGEFDEILQVIKYHEYEVYEFKVI